MSSFIKDKLREGNNDELETIKRCLKLMATFPMAKNDKLSVNDNIHTDPIIEQLIKTHNKWYDAVFETLTRPWQKKNSTLDKNSR